MSLAPIVIASVADGVKVALDSEHGIVYPLTACCGASAKGSANVESGVCCRACYAELDQSMGAGWSFGKEETAAIIDRNASEKRSLATWLEAHGAGNIAPTIAFTILLEALNRLP